MQASKRVVNQNSIIPLCICKCVHVLVCMGVQNWYFMLIWKIWMILKSINCSFILLIVSVLFSVWVFYNGLHITGKKRKTETTLKLKYLQMSIQEVCIKESYRSGTLILETNTGTNTHCTQKWRISHFCPIPHPAFFFFFWYSSETCVFNLVGLTELK